MSGILLVERSTTLSHLLRRTLDAAGIAARGEIANYLEALDHLRKADDLEQPYALAIVGAPARATREFGALLDYLRDAPDAPASLVLAHEESAELRAWAGASVRNRLLVWSQFGRIPGVVRQLAPDDGEPLAPAAELRNVPEVGIRLLFVDDSQSVRLAYRQLLERNGFTVETAGTIAEADALASSKHYDLVIVDYFLPDGSGDELCRRLSSKPGAPALAIITGSYREDVIKRCLEAGAIECMFKNEAKELFLARVRTLSRHVQMQKSIDADRQRLEGILGSVGDGVFGVDAEGKLTFVNPTAMRVLGYADDHELIGALAHDRFHHSGEDGRALFADGSPLTVAYRESKALDKLETVFWRKDRAGVPVECSVLPLTSLGRPQGAIVVFRDISERKSGERLRWELSHDALTGLANARHFNQVLSQEVERLREESGYSALLYIDLDRFNYVIDNAGNAGAEKLLVEIAQTLSRRLRESDLLARIEGDRMALLLTGVQLENLYPIAESFRELLHQCRYEASGGGKRHPTASIGVSILSRETPSAESALERARMACKTAKQRGRDQTEIFIGEQDVRVARELEAGWVDRLRTALEQERFVVLVQPIVPIAALPSDEGAIVERQGWRVNGVAKAGSEYLFEVLLRMVGKDGQLISPAVFVPLAERVGMMPMVDLWVVKRLLSHLSGLRELRAPIAFNINLSNTTLSDPDSLAALENAIVGSGVAAHQLVLEITETSELTSLQGARKFISRLRSIGCRFALDDFGTGFSSFAHLRHLPVDFVKIEGSFVEGMASSELDRKMVGSITHLAQSLKMRVIGEHVDGPQTLAALRSAGADYAQGNWLGEPRLLRVVDFPALFPAN